MANITYALNTLISKCTKITKISDVQITFYVTTMYIIITISTHCTFHYYW